MKITKIFFHLINFIFLIFYLYPGSILGFLLYGNFSKQPQVTPDFYFSSNHVYAFIVLSLFGLISHIKKKNIIIYFIFTISHSYIVKIVKKYGSGKLLMLNNC